MRAVLPIVVPALFVVASALPATAQEMSAEQLTRMLNGPPARPQAQTPVNEVQSSSSPVARAEPAAVQSSARSSSRPATGRAAPAAVAEQPVTRATPPAPVTRQPDTASRGPVALSAQAIAALPFRVELNGAEIIERPAGAGAKVYSVRQGEDYLLMIYTGPQSQYPIYEGEQATVAGRVSTIVLQDGKRVAAEHLFRREDAQPTDIHVWLMLTDGPKAALAERIGQSVDPR